MQEILDEILAENATLIALSPQKQSFNQDMVESHSLGFDILTDPGNVYAATLGLRFSVPKKIREIYEGFKINLAESNGDNSWTLPIPARIIVGKDGIVKNVDADPDYTIRPEPTSTIEILKKIRSR